MRGVMRVRGLLLHGLGGPASAGRAASGCRDPNEAELRTGASPVARFALGGGISCARPSRHQQIPLVPVKILEDRHGAVFLLPGLLREFHAALLHVPMVAL